jgi:hypothetical protein
LNDDACAVIAMLTNFKFFALAYLSDWWQYDENFVVGLRRQGNRRENLVRAATYYQVIRSFSRKWDGSQRLDEALNELDAALARVNNVITPANVDQTVTDLASSLGSIYQKKGKPQNLVSAASKFLWICRRTPVVIYDDRAKTCLTRMNATPGTTYKSYRDAWQLEFPKYQARIQSACLTLANGNVKNFAPNGSAKKGLKSVVRKRWFHERVFDKFLWWNGI